MERNPWDSHGDVLGSPTSNNSGSQLFHSNHVQLNSSGLLLQQMNMPARQPAGERSGPTGRAGALQGNTSRQRGDIEEGGRGLSAWFGEVYQRRATGASPIADVSDGGDDLWSSQTRNARETGGRASLSVDSFGLPLSPTSRQQRQRQQQRVSGAAAAVPVEVHEGLAHAVEAEGEAEFDRARAPLFGSVKRPHHFTAEERARMDLHESIDYAEPQSFLYKSKLTEALWRRHAVGGERARRGCLRWTMFIGIGIAVGLWSVLLFQTLDFLADVKLAAMQDFISAQQRAYERHHRKVGPDATTSAPLLENAPHTDRLGGGTDDDVREVGASSISLFHGVPVHVRAPDSHAGANASDDSSYGFVSFQALVYGYGVFALWSVVAAMLSSLCCVVMPSAAGSGIPDVMAYLNGIMFPRIFNIRNLVTKTLSCILAVSAGLPVGTEGPIIHIGSLIGAGLPTGRSRSLRCSATSLFSGFRNAKDERDFISAGAACGLTSAFSSPLGGMLFVLEEIATFFPVRLAWMVLVSCLSCMCVTQYVNTHLSGWRLVHHTSARSESFPSGNFRDSAIAMFYLATVPENLVPMNLLTFIPAVVVAVAAGFLAVLYTVNSIRLSRWRTRRLFPKPVLRVLEPGVFALLYATACYVTPLVFSQCQPVPPGLALNKERLNVELVTALCKTPSTPLRTAGSPLAEHAVSRQLYHPLATLAMTSPYNLLRLLFSRQTQGLFPASALLTHVLLYTAGSSYAGGMFISCGTVIPSLLIGAATGRLVGELFPSSAWADPGVLALIGAGAYFSGISRLTFSLIVIMMELTADLTHVTCLMLAVIIAKGVADRYCHSLYASTLELKAAPLLEVQTDIHEYDVFSARDIASTPVVTLGLTETVVRVLEVLHSTTHNAFPVVSPVTGTYAGIVTRAQLQCLLWVMCFREEEEEEKREEGERGGGEGDEGRGARHTGAGLSMTSSHQDSRGRLDISTVPVGTSPHGTSSSVSRTPATSHPPNTAATASAPSQRERRERWLFAQRHASAVELASVKETIFWERLPAMPPAGYFAMDVSQSFIDLSPYVDVSPYYVLEITCVSRTYYLFRHLGLRHLPVLDRHMRVTGILTRTNFVADRLQERLARAAAGGGAVTGQGHRTRNFFRHF